MGKFHLVDFAAHYQKGFRNHIVLITEVMDLAKKFDYFGCYATYFFYSDDVLTYMTTHAKKSGPTIGGYDGKVWASHFPLDLDHVDLSVSLGAARFFLDLFLSKWNVDPNGLQVYFSGSKGFHILLDIRLFGRIAPSKSIPALFAAMRRHLAQESPESLRQTVDLGIKDRVRLLRLPNTRHEKSDLYKIILSPEELNGIHPDEIRRLAQGKRPLSATDETGFISKFDLEQNSSAAQFMDHIRRQVRRFTRKPFQYHFRRPGDLTHLSFPCAGVQAIWESRVEPGFRNNCAIRLASELRLLGLGAAETREKMEEWNEKNQVGLPSWELESVTQSAYQPTFPYRYGCGDEILRHFCPLKSPESCRRHVEDTTKSQG